MALLARALCALAAGLAIVQVASVTNHGAPVSGVAVSIAISNGLSVSGTKDANGQFAFTYSNGSNHSARQQIEHIWLPLEDGTSILIGGESYRSTQTGSALNDWPLLFLDLFRRRASDW